MDLEPLGLPASYGQDRLFVYLRQDGSFDTALEALRRIKANTIETRLLNSRGLPNFSVDFYMLNARGEYAGVGMYASTYAVCTENGPQILPVEPLLEGKAED